MEWAAQGKVGIRNGDHCSRIVRHLAGMNKKGIISPTLNSQKVTLCVEGNISSGKSTLLHKLRKGSLEFKDRIEVLLCWQWLPCVHADSDTHTTLPQGTLFGCTFPSSQPYRRSPCVSLGSCTSPMCEVHILHTSLSRCPCSSSE